jgi:hypothetical protein
MTPATAEHNQVGTAFVGKGNNLSLGPAMAPNNFRDMRVVMQPPLDLFPDLRFVRCGSVMNTLFGLVAARSSTGEPGDRPFELFFGSGIDDMHDEPRDIRCEHGVGAVEQCGNLKTIDANERGRHRSTSQSVNEVDNSTGGMVISPTLR